MQTSGLQNRYCQFESDNSYHKILRLDVILLEPKDLDKFIDEDKKMNPQVEQIISLTFENTDPRLVIDSATVS